MNSKKVAIYCLNDPYNGKPIYIGQTTKRNSRLMEHLWCGRNRRTTPFYVQIGLWLDAGVKITMEIIDEVELPESAFWEEHYIFLYRSWGFKLFNQRLFPTKGGISYNARPKHSEIMRYKLKNDPEYAEKAMKNFMRVISDPEIQKLKMERSKIALAEEGILEKRAESIRAFHSRPFVVMNGDIFVGMWHNHITCAHDLGIKGPGVTRCLNGTRKSNHGNTYNYVKNTETTEMYAVDGTRYVTMYYENVN